MELTDNKSETEEIKYTLEQLSSGATTTEPTLSSQESQLLKPVLHNKRSQHNEKPAHHSEGSPRSPQPEKALTQQRRPSAAKSKKHKLKENKFMVTKGEKRRGRDKLRVWDYIYTLLSYDQPR